jgi:hypothetical protein
MKSRSCLLLFRYSYLLLVCVSRGRSVLTALWSTGSVRYFTLCPFQSECGPFEDFLFDSDVVKSCDGYGFNVHVILTVIVTASRSNCHYCN